eukprot:TRINITY_DN15541_c0_g1_i1.p1 TRINITY_DN15541_c0_g1~~TRINITY_DN15541_c0_g1_i1.p1  ORF type:complete len:469 (+),score=130.62 TRINITY_DN15541_c0_g1_i1:118-1524(+)
MTHFQPMPRSRSAAGLEQRSARSRSGSHGLSPPSSPTARAPPLSRSETLGSLSQSPCPPPPRFGKVSHYPHTGYTQAADGPLMWQHLKWQEKYCVPRQKGWLDPMDSPAWEGMNPRQVAEYFTKTAWGKKLGPKDFKGFLTWLERRFGNIVRAWRLALDLDGSGCLTYNEFGNAVRDLGYEGSIKGLWREIDDDGSGVISLAELSPDAAVLLSGFREVLMSKFKDSAEAWKGMDVRGRKVLSETEFVEACRKIGWTKKPELLHRYLCSGPQGVNTVKQGDLEWLGLEGLPEVLGMAEITTERGRQGHGPASKDAFLKQLKHRFGSLPRAWRLVLDLDGSGQITYNEFALACRTIGYEGSLKALWREFDDDGSGVISLYEVDPAAARLLHSFKTMLMKKHATAEAAWRHLDPTKLKSLSLQDFSSRLKELKFNKDHKSLFNMLAKDVHSCKLMVNDIKWLGILHLGLEE